MGALSDVTMGNVKINTSINEKDSDKDIFLKTFCEEKINDSNNPKEYLNIENNSLYLEKNKILTRPGGHPALKEMITEDEFREVYLTKFTDFHEKHGVSPSDKGEIIEILREEGTIILSSYTEEITISYDEFCDNYLDDNEAFHSFYDVDHTEEDKILDILESKGITVDFSTDEQNN